LDFNEAFAACLEGFSYLLSHFSTEILSQSSENSWIGKKEKIEIRHFTLHIAQKLFF